MTSLLGASVDSELAQLAERVSRSVVRVQCRSGGGSGVVWRSDGLVITNAHVVQQRNASVSLWDGRTVKAQICGYDSSRDLAALQIEPGQAADLIPIATGDARRLRVGQLVFALGNPHGEEPALSAGVIHAVNTRRPGGAGGWLQADVAIHPGNSGGPLFDVHGAAIGINSMIAYGLALAVPSWAVLDFVTPAASRPRIGVVCEPVRLQPRITRALALAADHGLLIVAVSPHSAAEKAGLLIGDIITAAAVGDGKPRSPEALTDVLASATGDEVLRLWILRGGTPEVCDLRFTFSSERTSAAA
ncbi:MAG: trypsin-like peptidase domain-containing protein [Candidatus Eremiobacteraeota bacterium]|nr:trypsin-like peptidase domain-containing protein [Candidatus Eremiobacteraeota bacterium]